MTRIRKHDVPYTTMSLSEARAHPHFFTKIEDIPKTELGVRAKNVLKDDGFIYLFELLDTDPYRHLRAPNFGVTCLKELNATLAARGLKLNTGFRDLRYDDHIGRIIKEDLEARQKREADFPPLDPEEVRRRTMVRAKKILARRNTPTAER